MRLTASQSELVAALQPTERAISTRSILPVLSGLKFEARSGRLSVTGTDLEMTIISELPVKVHNQGTIIAPGKLVVDIVRNLPDADVELRTEEDGMVILCRDAEFRMRTFSVADFPEIAGFPSQRDVRLSGSDLSHAVRQVARAVSRDETRPILGGVLLTISESSCRVVATDSYRLAIRDIPFTEKVQDMGVVVPARALEETAKLVGNEPADITVTTSQIFLEMGGVKISSRLLEGQFPNYQQLLPQEWSTEVKCDRDEMSGALRRVALVNPSTSIVKMAFSQDAGGVAISAVSPDVGSATERLAVDVSGEDLEIAFNAQFLMDGLQAVSEDQAILRFVGAGRPGVITPAAESNFTYLIMPVRVS